MKKNVLFFFAAVAMIGVMFTSCSKDEEVVAKAQPVDENNPVAVLNATFDEFDAVMSQYDFHELAPMVKALQQTSKPTKGVVSDFFVRGRERAAERDSALRNRLYNFVNSLIPTADKPIHFYRAFGDRESCLFLAWELTSYMVNDNAMHSNFIDTLYVVAEDSSLYEVYLESNNFSELSLRNRSYANSDLVQLRILKNGEEILGVDFGLLNEIDVRNDIYNNVSACAMTYNDMLVVSRVVRNDVEDFVVETIIHSGNTPIFNSRVSITSSGFLLNKTYPTDFDMTILPESRNVNFNGFIFDLKSYFSLIKQTREMMENGGTKEECDALVAELNDAAVIYMSISSNGSEVTFDSQSFSLNEETVYQPVMMIKLANAHYPMTLERFFEGMGINIEEIFAGLRLN